MEQILFLLVPHEMVVAEGAEAIITGGLSKLADDFFIGKKKPLWTTAVMGTQLADSKAPKGQRETHSCLPAKGRTPWSTFEGTRNVSALVIGDIGAP